MSRPAKKRDSAFFITKHGKRDANHGEVRDGLRKSGYLVSDTADSRHALDLCVHIGSDRWCWIEVKMPGGKLTADERKFIAKLEAAGARWAVVHSVSEALDALARAGGRGLAPTVAGQRVARGNLVAAGPWPAMPASLHDPAVKLWSVRPATARATETVEQRIRRLATSGTVRR